MKIYLSDFPILKIIESYYIGILSRLKLLKKYDKSSQMYNIKTYYQRNRYYENDVDIIDLSFGPYNQFLQNVKPIVFGSKNLKILDLGSGGGTLLRYLTRGNITFEKYVGIDIHVSKNESDQINEKIDFIEADIQEYDFSTSKYDVIFACNSLVYCEKKAIILERIIASLEKNGFFCLIEPTKSFFWEISFSNIRLFFSSRSYFIKHLNFPMVYSSTLYLRRLFNLDLIEMAYLLVFKNTKNNN